MRKDNLVNLMQSKEHILDGIYLDYLNHHPDCKGLNQERATLPMTKVRKARYANNVAKLIKIGSDDLEIQELLEVLNPKEDPKIYHYSYVSNGIQRRLIEIAKERYIEAEISAIEAAAYALYVDHSY